MIRKVEQLTRIAVACTATLLFVACSGSKDSPPAVTLTVATSAASVDAGGPPVTVTANLQNSSASISWQLTGPGSISPSTGATTTYTPPATVTSAATATVTASAAGLTASANITVNVPPCTITIAGPAAVDAGAAAVTYTATTSPACSGTVTWSLSGVGQISATTGSSTQYTPPATVASSQTATLTASIGSATRSLPITVRVPPNITVTGKVLDPNGQPVGNIPVIISNRPSTSTDASGNFTVTGVSTPYDCTAVWTQLGGVVVVYTGLTRRDPTIHFIDFGPTTPRTASVTGAVTPLSNVAGARLPVVAFGSPQTSTSSSATAGATEYTYRLTPGWFGPSSTTGALHALQWTTNTSGLPLEYIGYGTQRDVTISNGGSFSGHNITLTPASRASITGTISPFPTGTLMQKEVDVRFTSRALITVLDHVDRSVDFSYNTPNIPNSFIDLWALVVSPDGEYTWALSKGLAADASAIDLAVSAPPTLTLPVDRAIGINLATEFSWTTFQDGVHYVLMEGPGTAPYYYIVTKGNTARIPDLSGIGMPLPALTRYVWGVVAYAPFTNVDSFADPVNPAETMVQYGVSLGRTFDTQ